MPALYPFLIPSNLFAVSALRMLAQVHREARGDAAAARDCEALADEVEAALTAHGMMPDGQGGEVWAYEVDGYRQRDLHGRRQCAEPVGPAAARRGAIATTRCSGAPPRSRGASATRISSRAARREGIGGPHVGLDMIWPMSIVTHAMNSDDDADDPPMPALAEDDAWRHRLHARDLRQGRSGEVHADAGSPGPTGCSAS